MVQEILPALTAGLQQKHDLKACPLQFMYCYNLLLQGSRGFNRVTVHDFLGHVNMVSHQLTHRTDLQARHRSA